MKKRKATLSLLMVITLLFTSISFGSFASASEQKTDKEIFAENCDQAYWGGRLLAATTLQENHTEDCYAAISMYMAGDHENLAKLIRGNGPQAQTRSSSPEITLDELEAYLNASGMFIYNKEEAPAIIPYSSGTTDVNMNTPLITYNSSASEWVVSGGGSWKQHEYVDDIPYDVYPYRGKKTNIGGQDAVGVIFHNTSGTVPVLKRSTGYVHDGNGANMNLSNPYNMSSSKGVIFEYQDYVTFADVSFDCWYKYMGYGFSSTAVYSSTFSKYHGRAGSYYVHTWGSTNITGISVSVDSISVSWTNEANGWTVRNNNDAVF